MNNILFIDIGTTELIVLADPGFDSNADWYFDYDSQAIEGYQ